MKALSALLLAAAGCASAPVPRDAPAPPGARPADFFPLAVGNAWTWVDRSPGLPPGAAPERTVRVLERLPDGFHRDTDRGELRADADCLRDRSRRLLCAPLEAGRSWLSVTAPGATERFEIAGTGERVEVPAGRFAGCVRVRSHQRAGAGAESILELTYAPGVGPVRLETFAVVDGKVVPQVRAELKSYSLAR